ncbi:MAG: RNA polymerase sigma factor [Lentimicrobium sp.]|jgi:RNA polymerase sigma-70 factor (ECF subfamily)|nr:RNA polymerase sigma factor [Lentimicrobium sp.]MDD2528729.1 RNA polymerase sigma factor [Lentimicrobiaceae bacterium]MDD4599157.1 RNA polymerase sigma factor [Lentimicrobiaceae bacterium]MDY0025345.1 RNA polymerase sigma factor [Lentimicrobium sp.]HAH57057.1 RNA polymerase subunit sigma-70 [Bacteroidales bacterium]
MGQHDDMLVIDQVLNGNLAAYAALVDRYKDMVFTLVIKIVRNREEAEEASQDTFIKAFQALANFKQEAKFSTWLFRIAYNTAISRTRRKKIISAPIDDKLIENYSTDDVKQQMENLETEEKLKLMQEVLKQLPEDEQMLIELFYHNKQRVEEISVITGLTESNIKVKMHRIRKKMYAGMQEKIQLSPA